MKDGFWFPHLPAGTVGQVLCGLHGWTYHKTIYVYDVRHEVCTLCYPDVKNDKLMTTTTYADICIERAQNIFTSQHPLELDLKDDSLSSDVCELARRLKKACEAIRQVANVFDAQSGYDKSNLYGNLLVNLADSLERMPE